MGRLDVQLRTHQNLINKLTWQAYWKLPPGTRAWISFDDLRQDAQLFVIGAAPNYKPARSKFSTFVYRSLVNYFYTAVTAKYAAKRGDYKTDSLTLKTVPCRLGVVPIERYVQAKVRFERILATCPPYLCQEIHRWFLSPHYVNTKSRKFKALSQQFVSRSFAAGLGFEDLVALAQHNSISSMLVHIARERSSAP